MWRDPLRGWRAFGVVLFSLLALFELAELVGDVSGFFDLTSTMQFGGLTADLALQRLASVTIFALVVGSLAGVTAYGILGGRHWTVRVGTFTSIVLFLYALFQILSALVLLNNNNTTVVTAGLSYALLGLLAFWLVRRAMAKPPPFPRERTRLKRGGD